MFSVNEILTATQGHLLQGSLTAKVKGVSIDSRKVLPTELFVAVKGDIFDGHDFLKDVTAKGVRVLVVHRTVKMDDPKISIVLVKDTIRALGYLAHFHRLRFNMPLIAVTGSAGKTSTKEMIAAVLSTKYKVLKNEGTQNNHIGVPLTLLKLKPSHQAVVLECGTNQFGDIPWLSEISCPTAAVFTNIGESHLEKLKSPQGVLKEKWTLLDHMKPKGVVILNGDDTWLSKKISTVKTFKVVTYGAKPKSHVLARDIKIKDGRYLQFTTAKMVFELNSCGLHHMFNALATIACAKMLAVPIPKIWKALKNFEFPKGRGQILKLGEGWLVNDSYNANPVSMNGAIHTLGVLKSSGKKIMIAADMLELGTRAVHYHEQMGTRIAASGFEVLITVGNLSKHMAQEARRRNQRMQIFTCKDTDHAQKQLQKVLKNGDSVLVKGSRRMGMERLVDFLLRSPFDSVE